MPEDLPPDPFGEAPDPDLERLDDFNMRFTSAVEAQDRYSDVPDEELLAQCRDGFGAVTGDLIDDFSVDMATGYYARVGYLVRSADQFEGVLIGLRALPIDDDRKTALFQSMWHCASLEAIHLRHYVKPLESVGTESPYERLSFSHLFLQLDFLLKTGPEQLSAQIQRQGPDFYHALMWAVENNELEAEWVARICSTDE